MLQKCGVAGLAQRVIRVLKERRLLNSEIAKLLNINEEVLLKKSKNFLRKAASYEITAGKLFINERGVKDRVYELIRHEPERAMASCKLRNNIYFGVNKKSRMSKRNVFLEAARERSRLINTGNYSREEEVKLCEKYGL
ncbi:hypothetical protein IU871_000718 [Salmonella enterica subsp. enterica serovar Havana]|uniref:Uncharacterized protein n=2 Tax=Salmonella enterica I TaxID=59201 RepID=A0A610IKC9_SALET|nr:hypothetical protein [Salmonella enterica]EBU2944152.1 hypothetical protein [Salmonella enterica subsp. enterica]EBA1299546.1 hypothetical protein [Salmonella enterica]EBG9920958.1 hypothetical protein [Salmonella enterica]ECD2817696.1 hypothetical protein [Salmonella enterica subsp. enterica serovar Havana]ECV5688407.1 hypothetical protein [Salmonella enterica subsp. enterica serovar Havana]